MPGTRLPGRSKRGFDLDALIGRGADLAEMVRELGIKPIAGGDGTGGEDDKPKDGDGDDKPNGGKGDGTPGDKPKPDEPKFTQADVDRIVTDRLSRAKADADKAADKARREAEEKAATENGEFKKLAEQRAATITDLEAQVATLEQVTAERDRYQAALSEHLTAQRKDLPKHVLELLDEMPVDKQLTWLAKNREQVTGSGNGRVPATPRPSGGNANDRVEKNREILARTGAYARF